MGNLSATQLAELSQSAITAHTLLEIDLPDGTTLRLARGPLPSASRGYYHPRLVSLSPFKSTLDLVRFTLQCPERSATVSDEPEGSDRVGWMSRKIATYGDALHNSPVREYLASTVAPADWYLASTGRLVSGGVDGGQATLTFRPNDAELQAVYKPPRVRAEDWPNCPTENLDRVIPGPYGLLSDRGQPTMSGYVEAIYVDNVGWRYVVSFGWCHQGRDVFSNGTLITTNYAWAAVKVNGRRYLLIDSATDRTTNTITANLLGYARADATYGGGTWMPTGTDQLAHFLLNNAYVPSQSGEWIPYANWGNYGLDIASWNAAGAQLGSRAAGAPYVCGRLYGDEKKFIDYLNDGCISMGVAPYWNTQGKLALHFDDPCIDPYALTASPIFRRGTNLFSIRRSPGQSEAVYLGEAGWAPDASQQGDLRVQDPSAPGAGTERVDMRSGPPTEY